MKIILIPSQVSWIILVFRFLMLKYVANKDDADFYESLHYNYNQQSAKVKILISLLDWIWTTSFVDVFNWISTRFGWDMCILFRLPRYNQTDVYIYSVPGWIMLWHLKQYVLDSCPGLSINTNMDPSNGCLKYDETHVLDSTASYISSNL